MKTNRLILGLATVALAVSSLAEGISSAWNANAEWFMYAPSFAFREVSGAVKYRFRVLDDCHVAHDFTAAKPTESLESVWNALPKGFVTVTCSALDGKDAVIGLAGERTFWKNAAFKEGSYPKAKRSYAEAVRMGYEYLLDRKANRYFLEKGRPDPSYDLNCYPAKMHSATVRAMCAYLKANLSRKDDALRLAKLSVDYLIAIAEPEGRPLAGWPHTYEGKQATAGMYAGQQMLIYPAGAGRAFLELHAVTQENRYLAAAKRIAATYLRLQDKDGTWYLKLYEKDGKPVNPNRLMPNGVIDFLEELYGVTKDARYREAADRAFAYIDRGPLKTWNWEGQFEDVPPSQPYYNLTKHPACDTAIYLLKRFPDDQRRRQQANDLIRWSEDQFVAWETPARKDGTGFRNRKGFKPRWSHGWQTRYSIWHCPAVMEQYSWYQPIDASAAKMIRAYLAYHRVTGDALALAKAKALADSAVNNQRDNGLSPTGWFGNYDEYHNWINCHIATIMALQQMYCVDVCKTPGGTPYVFTDREIYVDHQKNHRSGHMGHALIDVGGGRILDFNSNVDGDRSTGHSGYGWMEYRISSDYGRSWGAPRVLPYSKRLFAEGKHTALCEKGVRAPDGRIILFFQITDASREICCSPWSASTMCFSMDGGETFSDAVPTGAKSGRIYDAVVDDRCVYFLVQENENFLGTSPEHVYKVYRSEAGGPFVGVTLPLSAKGKGYGAMEFAKDGSLIAYVYDSAHEDQLEHVVSRDRGLTWSQPARSLVAKRIRNPQVRRLNDTWFLVGRNGGTGEGLVLYSSDDGINWDEGRMVDRRPTKDGTGYYSCLLPVFEPGQVPRLLLQYSHVYSQNRVNIAHRWIELTATNVTAR